jgi:hypothetical protein
MMFHRATRSDCWAHLGKFSVGFPCVPVGARFRVGGGVINNQLNLYNVISRPLKKTLP